MFFHIHDSGFQKATCVFTEVDELHIEVDERVNASVLFTYSGVESQVKSNITLHAKSTLTIMLKKAGHGNVHFQQTIQVHKDATLHLAYYDMEDTVFTLCNEVNLLEEGASVTIQSAVIATSKKHMQIHVHHHVPYTFSDMKHYAIVQKHGDYAMEACGKIYKGAHASASHQTTRVLTLSEHQKASVVPLLYIDEDDVKASHATSLGQPDENQLYYLQTRGLNRVKALGLLSIGYLMPLTTFFPQEDIQQELKDEIEMKVGLHV